MHRLIAIERSRTLRYVLSRVFRGSGFAVDIYSGFSSGLRALLANRGCGRDYAGIVLGWPAGTDSATDELIKVLEERPFAEIFVLVLTYEPSPSARKWVTERGYGAHLLWQSYTDIIRTIDLHVKRETPTPVRIPDAIATGADVNVLLVDDSPSSRVFFRKLLLTRGYHVETASHGAEAMDRLEQGNFQIAIIDYYLPDITGDQLCKKIKAAEGADSLACAVITSAYSDALLRDCLNAGAIECMFKSEPPELFIAQVDAMARSVRNHQALLERQELLDGVLGAVGEGVVVVDESDKILYINQAALMWLGYANEDELVGEMARNILQTPAVDANAGTDTRRPSLAETEQGAIVESIPQILIRRDGQRIAVLTSAYVLRLHNRRIGTVVAFRYQTERPTSDQQVWWQATHDPLTKLLNRNYFEVQIETELHRLRASNSHNVLVILALEPVPHTAPEVLESELEPIVDGLPRLLLEVVGDLLVRRTRQGDLLAYLGAGEFAAVFRNVEREVIMILRRMFQRILDKARTSTPYEFDGTIGIAVMDGSIKSPQEAIARAEHARKLAKKKGQDQIHLYTIDGSTPSTGDGTSSG